MDKINVFFRFVFISVFILISIKYNPAFSQNITNTLGTSGIFSIKDATNIFLSLNQSDGYCNLNYCLKLPNTTASNIGVIFKGTDRFLHNYGGYNTFLGINAGNFTLTGWYNTAIGYNVLGPNTTGSRNTGVGCNSLMSNTEGGGNTAMGDASLQSNTTGSSNTAIGQYSMRFNTTGNNNTALGFYSLIDNSTGSNNTAIGYYCLRPNSTGYENTGVGGLSLYYNTTGYKNTAVGYQSLHFNSSGNENSAFGYYSLISNSTGNANTALGINSLRGNTTGSYNIGIGGGLYGNSTGSNNISLGVCALFYNAGGNSNIGIGSYSIHRNSNGNYNTVIGQGALGYLTNGSNNVVIGGEASNLLTSGSNIICIGHNSNPSNSTVSDEITLGNNSISTFRCAVTTITALSDARDKKNISDLNLGLDFLLKIKPRIYNWDKREWYDNNISDGTKMQENLTAGFIAQELDEVQKSENAEWLNLVLKNNPDKLEATPGNLLPVMVKAIQELKTENDKLKDRLTALEQKSETQNTKTAGLILINPESGIWFTVLFSAVLSGIFLLKKYNQK